MANGIRISLKTGSPHWPWWPSGRSGAATGRKGPGPWDASASWSSLLLDNDAGAPANSTVPSRGFRDRRGQLVDVGAGCHGIGAGRVSRLASQRGRGTGGDVTVDDEVRRAVDDRTGTGEVAAGPVAGPRMSTPGGDAEVRFADRCSRCAGGPAHGPALGGWDRNTGERGREPVLPLVRAGGERVPRRR